ncbi:shikimate dehydrogenase [Glaciecola siphonariae]|uniref:Shikimate dehydrogenase (NADP(+)) n=1 Tax=Glaciecola siphonariae TaxID=521012 RepID=A0ABV9LSA2_9ALTE
MTPKACVFGNPIAQSKSPIIHQHFASQQGIALLYEKRCPEVAAFESELTAFFASEETVGANVTAPFKERALVWASDLSEQARRAGAVNTLIKHVNGITGDNTDGVGIVADLAFHGFDINDKNVLMIGAGGAARGALPAIVDAGAASLTVYNRTRERASALIEHAGSYVDETACNLRVFSKGMNEFDLIINATTLSLQGQLPELPSTIYADATLAYDMVYLDKDTVFMDAALNAGCTKVVDGLGMLLEQAAFSFEHWFGVKPNTDELREKLRQN